MRSKAAVILALVMGVLAVLMVSVYLNSREGELLELRAMKPVLIASQDILENNVIDDRMIEQIEVPQKYFQPKAESDKARVIGRVASVPIPKGAQVLGTYLLDANRTALAYEVPRGRRAITIAVNDVTGVAGLVRPGNFVDILGTFEFGRPVATSATGRVSFADERTETRLMWQNVQVVAVEREHQRERPTTRPVEGQTIAGAAAVAAAQQQERERTVANVTLLVAPQQAQELVLAQQIGTLTLMLRSNLDAGQVVDLGTLDPFGLLKVQIPIKPRAQPVWREIRGSRSVF
jgi:pilus assembly protein CpaB